MTSASIPRSPSTMYWSRGGLSPPTPAPLMHVPGSTTMYSITPQYYHYPVVSSSPPPGTTTQQHREKDLLGFTPQFHRLTTPLLTHVAHLPLPPSPTLDISDMDNSDVSDSSSSSDDDSDDDDRRRRDPVALAVRASAASLAPVRVIEKGWLDAAQPVLPRAAELPQPLLRFIQQQSLSVLGCHVRCPKPVPPRVGAMLPALPLVRRLLNTFSPPAPSSLPISPIPASPSIFPPLPPPVMSYYGPITPSSATDSDDPSAVSATSLAPQATSICSIASHAPADFGHRVVSLSEAKVVVSYDARSSTRDLSHAAVHFWEQSCLEPFSTQKNITYLILPPPAPMSSVESAQLVAFFHNFSAVYENCQLGRHRPACAPDHLPLLLLPSHTPVTPSPISPAPVSSGSNGSGATMTSPHHAQQTPVASVASSTTNTTAAAPTTAQSSPPGGSVSGYTYPAAPVARTPIVSPPPPLSPIGAHTPPHDHVDQFGNESKQEMNPNTASSTTRGLPSLSATAGAFSALPMSPMTPGTFDHPHPSPGAPAMSPSSSASYPSSMNAQCGLRSYYQQATIALMDEMRAMAERRAANPDHESFDSLVVYVVCRPDYPHNLMLLADHWAKLFPTPPTPPSSSSSASASPAQPVSSSNSSDDILRTLDLSFALQFVPLPTVTNPVGRSMRELALGVYSKVCRPLARIEKFLNPDTELPATFDTYYEPAIVLASEPPLLATYTNTTPSSMMSPTPLLPPPSSMDSFGAGMSTNSSGNGTTPSSNEVKDPLRTLHVAYAWSKERHYLMGVCVDARGEVLQTCIMKRITHRSVSIYVTLLLLHESH
jgi:hypothetical protein